MHAHLKSHLSTISFVDISMTCEDKQVLTNVIISSRLSVLSSNVYELHRFVK